MLSVLLTVILVLVVTGILLWGLDQFPGINPTIKQMIKVLVIVVAGIWVVVEIFSLLGVHLALPR